MACEKKPYNPGQKSLDSTTILIFFCHISVPLLKQCILFKIFLQFSLPPPYTKLKLGKILDTRVQHCVWGEGRGWTCVNWKTPQKCKSVPRLLSVIVDKRYRAFSNGTSCGSYWCFKTMKRRPCWCPKQWNGCHFLVFQTNPVGVKLFSYVLKNSFFCCNKFA